VHTVGVGSAVNRSLTGAAARAGRGVEVIVGLGEDAERAARRLVARTDAPLVVDVRIEGTAFVEHAPSALPDLFAGAPLLVSARVRPEGGDLTVRGRTASGAWQADVRVPPAAVGDGRRALASLFGREAVEDLEAQCAALDGRRRPARGMADARTLDAQIEAIGLRYGIATRLTSWVAVDEVPSVDPREPTMRVRVPHELPHGVSMEGLGLRSTVLFGDLGTSLGPASAAPEIAYMPSGAEELRGPVRERRTRSFGEDPPRAAAPRMVRFAHSPRNLRGRCIAGPDRLVIEVLVDGRPLEWTAPVSVDVTWTDGSTTTEAVVSDRSTRAGIVAAGQSLRFVLPGPRAGAMPRSVAIVAGNQHLVIDL
jgi:Ca-activated chloride channel family protein